LGFENQMLMNKYIYGMHLFKMKHFHVTSF
jgi:hypothetical protein